jgi:hypothetical protein
MGDRLTKNPPDLSSDLVSDTERKSKKDFCTSFKKKRKGAAKLEYLKFTFLTR